MNPESPEIQLLQLRNLVLKLGRKPSPSVIRLLCESIWGTPGAMRYQHLDTEHKIHDLHDPWFLTLEKEEEAIGVLCLDQRVTNGLDTFYIRYFSFAEGMRRKGVGVGEAAGDTPASRGQGMFKRFSSTFFANPAPLLEAAGTPKAVFYAFVELENARSREMVEQMGLKPCGRFGTYIFSRIFPRKKASVRRALPTEYAQLREIVRSAYSDHAFFTDHGLFYKDNFFVLEVDGKIVAGCQAHQVHWRVVEVPGFAGKLIMNVVPWVPLLSRLFNPKKFDFAAIEGLFCLPGHENCLQDLLEGVLASQGLYAALMWMSPDAAISKAIQSNVRLGIMQRIKKDFYATVVMNAYGLQEAEIKALQAKPAYISAFDTT